MLHSPDSDCSGKWLRMEGKRTEVGGGIRPGCWEEGGEELPACLRITSLWNGARLWADVNIW